MPKMHELLGVEASLKGQASKTRNELIVTFDKRVHLFQGRIKTFRPLDETQPHTTEDKQDIQSSIAAEIKWVSTYQAKAVDIVFQIDLANKEAKADVLDEDGNILWKDVPATTLLHLEKHRIPEWKALIEAIPTLDPAKGFVEDPQNGDGHFKAREVVNPRSKKGKKVYIKYEATDKHPAQTELIDEDIPVGTLLTQEWSALITPQKKSELLDQVERLARAVSSARSKANEHSIETKDKKIGAELLDYVFKPLLT